MENIEWRILKYLRHPTAECINDIMEYVDEKRVICDVLTESMFQYDEEMTRDYVVKRPKYFIDNRQHIHSKLLPEYLLLVENAISFEESKFYNHFTKIKDYSYWENEIICLSNGEGLTESVCNLYEGTYPSEYNENNNIPTYKLTWYNCNLWNNDYSHIVDLMTYNYHRWKHISLKSPCRLLGCSIGKQSKFLYLFPKYY